MKRNEKDDFDRMLDKEIGLPGSPLRVEFEKRAEAFMLGVLIRQARKDAHITQKELAERVGTKRSYISRIENDASDIQVSTLRRIVEVGLHGILEITIKTAS
jgi:HTH-type transcriptional regulator/antitoxin HipB